MKRKNARVIICALLMVSALLLSSCGAVNKYYNGVSEDAAFDMVTESETFDPKSSYEEKSTASGGNLTLSDVPNESANRKIVYKSWARMQTKEFDDALASLKTLCSKYGAYYESSSMYGNNINYQNERSAQYVIRIPVQNYTAFLDEVGGIGSIVNSGENNQDITEQYVDTEARLASAELREERVLVLLENANNLDDVLALERELSDIRYEIESLTGSLRKYDSLVNYATFELNINEVVEYTPPVVTPKTFGEKLAQSFRAGWNDFVSFWQSVVIVITYGLFTLLTFVFISIVAIVIVARNYRKSRISKKASEENAKKKD